MARPRLFDFRDPLPMPAGSGRLVQSMLEQAVRVGLLLGLASGRPVTVSCPGVGRATLADVGTPRVVWALLECGLPSPAVLVVQPEAAIALADLFMGGTGESDVRQVSPLEQSLSVGHLVEALAPLAEALADRGVQAFRAGLPSDEPLPTGAGEVLAVPLDITLPDSRVRVTVCLPAKSLLPADAEPVAALPAAGSDRVLGEIPIDVSLRLPATTVTAEDVEDLAPGDVIRIDPEAADQLVGVLQGDDGDVAVLTASLGRRGRRRAVVVHDLLGGN